MVASSSLENHEENQGDWDLECFHAAYDALGSGTTTTTTMAMGGNHHSKTNITTGLQWAMKLQRLILSTAMSLVSRNAITRLRHFRYAYVTAASTTGSTSGAAAPTTNDAFTTTAAATTTTSTTMASYHVLAKPLALTRLAHYLMDMHRANGKWIGGNGKTLPLILLAEQPATRTFLVVGQEMSEKLGHLSPNKFGQYFELVSQSMKGAVARLELLDSHVVEVDAAHAERFLEQLHYFMDSV